MSETPQGVDQTLGSGVAGNAEQPPATNEARTDDTLRTDPDDTVGGLQEATEQSEHADPDA